MIEPQSAHDGASSWTRKATFCEREPTWIATGFACPFDSERVAACACGPAAAEPEAEEAPGPVAGGAELDASAGGDSVPLEVAGGADARADESDAVPDAATADAAGADAGAIAAPAASSSSPVPDLSMSPSASRSSFGRNFEPSHRKM